MSKLSLNVKDFKAIAKANIQLDGITVLSGINSSGKSTLSKLLYYIVKLTLEFENTQINNLSNEWERVIFSLTRLSDDFQIESEGDIYRLWNAKSKSLDIESLHRLFCSLLSEIEQSFLKREQVKSFTDKEITRIINALTIRIRQGSKNIKPFNNVTDLFNNIRTLSDDRLKETHIRIKSRPLLLFQSELSQYFKSYNVPVEFFEDDTSILDNKSKRLNNFFSLEHIFYSDTPMAISNYTYNRRFSDSTDLHWEFLRNTILNSPTVSLNSKQKKANEEISKIISGKVSLKKSEFDRGFNYTRSTDNLTIDLVDSATGIKSFALLQILLTEGFLNEKTLLILDEPEAHLHPQWIVEYARILILLNKKLGVRFMIASHNPDMISALRYISEKEGILDQMHFYLAEKQDNTEQFIYRDLNNDIEPIFASFNIALDRINQYGV